MEPKAAALSLDHTKARSLADGIVICLVLNRLDIAHDIEELIGGNRSSCRESEQGRDE